MDINPHSPLKILNGVGSLPVQPMPSHQMSIVDVFFQDVFFPGFSGISATMQQVLAGNVDSYARLLCIGGMLVFLARYAYRYVKKVVETYFSS